MSGKIEVICGLYSLLDHTMACTCGSHSEIIDARKRAFILFNQLCRERNLRLDSVLSNAFLETCLLEEPFRRDQVIEQAVEFIKTHCVESAPIPVMAKTMTGDLILLEYHPERDARDLLYQLQSLDPEKYLLGSVSLHRSEEKKGQPVEENEIFFLFHHGASMMEYAPERDEVGCRNNEVKIRYWFRQQTSKDITTYTPIEYCICHRAVRFELNPFKDARWVSFDELHLFYGSSIRRMEISNILGAIRHGQF